ncbi:MAG: hypothetical protein E6J14_03390 [Chloroflexi bacterium]|nr:MAG: hypothetical protein E6J14_03390 [Chloroflexota bacterium]
MRSLRRDLVHHRFSRGSAVLYVVLLSPVLLLMLALVVEGGALQLERERLRSAVDEAVVDAGAVAASGGTEARLDQSRAAEMVRASLLDNLRPLQGELAGADAAEVAARAEVAVVQSVPSPDPFHPDVILHRPTIEVRVRAPVRSDLLHVLAGLAPSLTMTVVAGADLRLAGSA